MQFPGRSRRTLALAEVSPLHCLHEVYVCRVGHEDQKYVQYIVP